jgi:putative phosphoesterase
MINLLAIGDAHIPRRAREIPPKIYEKLETLAEERLFDYTFFTGDVIDAPEFIEFLKLRTKRDFFRVIGNMDYYGGNRDAPVFQKLELSNHLLIGMTHGAQITPRGDHDQLELLAVEKSYNILISGHTHQEEMTLTKNGFLLLNPGSVTGAWSFVASQIPSFIVIKVNEETGNIAIILYQLITRENIISEKQDYFIFDGKTIKRI